MSGLQRLLDLVDRKTDELAARLTSASGAPAVTMRGRELTLPGLVTLLALGQRTRPAAALPVSGLASDVIDRLLDEAAKRAGLPVSADEAREVVRLLTSGEFLEDLSSGLVAVLGLVPRAPAALVGDVLSLPSLPEALADAVRADLRDDPSRPVRDVLIDLRDGRLDTRRVILRHTLRVLLGQAAPGALAGVLRTLLGPGNATFRLAVIVYARSQGIDIDEKDLDALLAALDPASPDLGVLLDRGLERFRQEYGKAAHAVSILERLSSRVRAIP
jgi:hypothetical protein